MQRLIVDRSGMSPLVFEGEQIATADCRLADDGQLRPRWHSLAVFVSESGTHVVQIEYHSTFRNEIGFTEVHGCRSPEQVARLLADHDPTIHVDGWPPLPKFAGRQRKLLDGIRKTYANAVSLVLRDERFGVAPEACVESCFEPLHANLLSICKKLACLMTVGCHAESSANDETEAGRLLAEMADVVSKL